MCVCSFISLQGSQYHRDLPQNKSIKQNTHKYTNIQKYAHIYREIQTFPEKFEMFKHHTQSHWKQGITNTTTKNYNLVEVYSYMQSIF